VPDPRTLFEGNLRSLGDRELAGRLAKVRPDFSAPRCYRFLEARSGDPVPVLISGPGTHPGEDARGSGGIPAHGASAAGRPLHSLVDPRREGLRLMSTLNGEDFLIFLGLGGAYPIEAALERPATGRLIIVEFGLCGLAELFGLRDLSPVFGDPRVQVLADPAPGLLERLILDTYVPALSQALRVLPLRPRIEGSPEEFERAAGEIRSAMDRLSADYSVQAHFGIRMFRNILRNLLNVPEQAVPLPRIRRAAVCAAGPSLDLQLPRIAAARGKKEGPFLIATDTSLPALLGAGLEPDAVISIDCQHISYRHFIPPQGFRNGRRQGPLIPVPLFLDLASPPLLASLAASPVFFSGGHPLASYLSSRWRPFPAIDSSGGNVTYAAVSLAEFLGAREIELYGADFSYPLGRTYARGTYIFPYFETRQCRLDSLEGLFSRFLYRTALEKKDSPQGWYYETETLVRYRKSLEARGEGLGLIPAPGLGACIGMAPGPRPPAPGIPASGVPVRGNPLPAGEFPAISKSPAVSQSPAAGEFLAGYKAKLRSLPALNPGASSVEERRILTTLLPLAAALRRKEPDLRGGELIERTRDYAVAEIDRVLSAAQFRP
jgi:hypothetical protein